MRDLVKIYRYDMQASILGITSLQSICERRLKSQIGRRDITILNITRVENKKENCLDCYIDYEFWGGK